MFGKDSIPIILSRHLVQDIDTLEDWKRVEFMYQALNNISDIKYIGCEIIITYDDYNTHKTIIQNLNEIESICSTLKNDEDYYNVEYSKKYKYNDKFLYSTSEQIQVLNINISKKVILLDSVHNKIIDIYNNQDLIKEDVKSCIDDLENLLNEIE